MKFATVAVLAFALIVRLATASGDLWLDEIWSVQSATGAEHWWNLFTDLHSDNNHHLNSLWIRLVGLGHHPIVYRGLSLAASITTVAVLGRSPLLRNRTERIVGVLAGATCYPLILYGSEARGYSLAMLCGLVALHSAIRSWRFAFAASVVVGLLAHATFLFAWIAIAVWMLCRGRAEWLTFQRPCLFVVGVYLIAVVRPMQVGGGDDVDSTRLLVEFTQACYGHFAIAIAFGLLVARGLWRSGREWLVLLLVVLLVPVMAARHAEYLHVRYFVICVPILLLFSVRGLSELALRSRVAATALGVLWLFGQVQPTFELIRHGRGNTGELCRYLQRQGGLEIASDHDFRMRTALAYSSGALTFRLDGEQSDWLLIQRERPIEHIRRSLVTEAGQRFTFARYFPTAPLSGLHSYVYRADDRAKTAVTESAYTSRNSGPPERN